MSARASAAPGASRAAERRSSCSSRAALAAGPRRGPARPQGALDDRPAAPLPRPGGADVRRAADRRPAPAWRRPTWPGGRSTPGSTPATSRALDLIVAAFVAVADRSTRSRTYAETYLVGWVGTRALQDLRERIFAHLQSMSIGFFTRSSPGVLISRMTNDVEALNQLVTTAW